MGENYTRDLNTALFIKSVILMTATETNAPAELGPDPTLDRGGKDLSEGYGRVNADAAIELIREEHIIGGTEDDAFGDGVFDRKAFARHVSLEAGEQYTFSLTVPEDADYDLYLYRYGKEGGFMIGSAFSEGDPILVAQSTTATLGGVETFNFIPTESGTFALIAKRTSGSGPFALQSSANTATDTEAPTVMLTSPGAGAIFTPGQPFTITWVSSDSVGVASHDLLFSMDGTDTFVVTIAQGLSGDEQSFTWEVPATLMAQGGRVRVIARDASGNAGHADAPSSPDLIITQVRVSPEMVAAGGNVSVDVTVANIGEAPASSAAHRLVISSDPVIDVNDEGIGFARTGVLAAGASVTVLGRGRLPIRIQPGVYYLGVIADFNNQARELREDNNTAAARITVTGG
jgi:hypothetical protein